MLSSTLTTLFENTFRSIENTMIVKLGAILFSYSLINLIRSASIKLPIPILHFPTGSDSEKLSLESFTA